MCAKNELVQTEISETYSSLPESSHWSFETVATKEFDMDSEYAPKVTVRIRELNVKKDEVAK